MRPSSGGNGTANEVEVTWMTGRGSQVPPRPKRTPYACGVGVIAPADQLMPSAHAVSRTAETTNAPVTSFKLAVRPALPEGALFGCVSIVASIKNRRLITLRSMIKKRTPNTSQPVGFEPPGSLKNPLQVGVRPPVSRVRFDRRLGRHGTEFINRAGHAPRMS